MANLNPKQIFQWDSRARRYRDARGRFIKDQVITSEIEILINDSKGRMRALGQQIVDRTITLKNFELQMRTEIKTAHTAAAAAAAGGWKEMSPADWGRVGAITREEYKLLNKFVRAVRSGKQPRNGTARARAGRYAGTARVTHQLMRQSFETAAGKDEARRLLSAAEHCAGCLRQAARKWVPIRELAPIGSQECGPNCKCRVVFRKAPKAKQKAA